MRHLYVRTELDNLFIPVLMCSKINASSESSIHKYTQCLLVVVNRGSTVIFCLFLSLLNFPYICVLISSGGQVPIVSVI